MPKQYPNRRATAFAAFAVAVAVAGACSPAHARVVDLRAAAFAGGSTGFGTNAGRRDFFELVRGPAAGVELGLSVLLADISFNFVQVMRAGGYGRTEGPGSGFFVGTLTQVLLGFRTEYEVAEDWVLQPRLQVGLAAGTRGAIDLPLDSEQISHKGLITQAGLALDHFFSPFLSIGALGQMGYHRFLQGAMVLNDPASWGNGYHFSLFTTFTAHFGI